MSAPGRQPPSRPIVLGRAALTVVFVGALYSLIPLTDAAFRATTGNGSSSFSSGTVTISDDDGGSAMFPAALMSTSSSPAAECVTVQYTGTAQAAVKLYMTFAGDTGVLTYTTLKIEEGTGGSSGSCSGFTPTTTVFSAALNTWSATSSATAIGSWTPNGAASLTYRFTFTLSGSTPQLQQGSQVTTTTTWEAKAGT